MKRINHAEMRSLAKPPNTETVMRFDRNCRRDIFQSSFPFVRRKKKRGKRRDEKRRRFNLIYLIEFEKCRRTSPLTVKGPIYSVGNRCNITHETYAPVWRARKIRRNVNGIIRMLTGANDETGCADDLLES